MPSVPNFTLTAFEKTRSCVTSGERIEEWQGFTNSQSNETCYDLCYKSSDFQHFYIHISFRSDIQGGNVGYNQH